MATPPSPSTTSTFASPSPPRVRWWSARRSTSPPGACPSRASSPTPPPMSRGSTPVTRPSAMRASSTSGPASPPRRCGPPTPRPTSCSRAPAPDGLGLTAGGGIRFTAHIGPGSLVFTGAIEAPEGLPFLTLPGGTTIDEAELTFTREGGENTLGLHVAATVQATTAVTVDLVLGLSDGSFTGEVDVTDLAAVRPDRHRPARLDRAVPQRRRRHGGPGLDQRLGRFGGRPHRGRRVRLVHPPRSEPRHRRHRRRRRRRHRRQGRPHRRGPRLHQGRSRTPGSAPAAGASPSRPRRPPTGPRPTASRSSPTCPAPSRRRPRPPR